MIRALAKTPSPYATVIASEIFSTGLILSDTDFRNFVQYGNQTGLDMALVQNSYRYHTTLDTVDNIEPGALQHTGENLIPLLEYLTSSDTTMGNSHESTPILPHAPTSHTIFFSALGGKVFVVYSRATATLVYGIIAALVTVIATDRVDWATHKKAYTLGVVGVLGGLVSAVVGANSVAFLTSVVLGKPMSWCVSSLPVLLLFSRATRADARTPLSRPPLPRLAHLFLARLSLAHLRPTVSSDSPA